MSGFNLADLPGWGRELLEDARVARLGMIDDDGRPRVLPVTFALWDGSAWSAVDDKPKRRPGAELARVRFLRRRPEAALTVDRYDDDWSKLAWVQLLGDVEVVDVEHAPQALDALSDKYAAYRERPPQGPLLKLAPGRATCWRASG
jgi:PPOX class probable F420-dependent enzyme